MNCNKQKKKEERNFEQRFAECTRDKNILKSCYVPIVKLSENAISDFLYPCDCHIDSLLKNEISLVSSSNSIHSHLEGYFSSSETEEARCEKFSLVKHCKEKISDDPLYSRMSAEIIVRNDETEISYSSHEPVSDLSSLPNLKNEERVKDSTFKEIYIPQGKKNTKHKLSKLHQFKSTEKTSSARIMDLNVMNSVSEALKNYAKETVCKNSNISSDVSDTFENMKDYESEVDADISSSDDDECRLIINPNTAGFTGDILYLDLNSNPNLNCSEKCLEHMDIINIEELINCVKDCQKMSKATDKKLDVKMHSLSDHHQVLFQQNLASDNEDNMCQRTVCSPFFYGEQTDVSETIQVFLGKNAYLNSHLDVLLKFDNKLQVNNVLNGKMIQVGNNKSSHQSRKKYTSSENMITKEEECNEKTKLNNEKCIDNASTKFDEVSSLQLMTSEINKIALENVENMELEINSKKSKKFLNTYSEIGCSSDFSISKNNQINLNDETDKGMQLSDSNTGVEINPESSNKYLCTNSETYSSINFLFNKSKEENLDKEADKDFQLNGCNTDLEINSENFKEYLTGSSETDSSSSFLVSKKTQGNLNDLNNETSKDSQLNDHDLLGIKNKQCHLDDLNEEEIDETISIIAPSPGHLFDTSDSDEDDKDLSFKRHSQKEILPPVSTLHNETITSTLNNQPGQITHRIQETSSSNVNNAMESAFFNYAQKENHKNCDFESAVRHSFCRSFLRKGHCSRSMCRYRHSYPSIEEMPAKDKADMFLSKLEEHCNDGILNKAFEKVHNELQDHPSVKYKALIMLLNNSVKLNNISLIKEVFLLTKKFNAYNSNLCSSFIISCKDHLNLVSDSILELFGICKLKKIRLQKEAVDFLLDAFHHDWRHLIAVMNFICCINKMQVPQQLLNQCLPVMKNEPQLISQMNDLLNKLPIEQFAQIEPIAVEDFILLLEMYNHSAEDLKCRLRIAHSNQLFTGNLPSTNLYENKTMHLIKHYINKERWSRLIEIFNEYGIVKKDGMVIQFIHSCFCSQMDNLGEKFRSFIREVTINGKSDLSASNRFLLGQMGTALMLEAHSSNELKAAFEVLETLHCYNINYYELQNLTLPQLQTSGLSINCIPPWVIVTPSRVALVATDICLELKKPEEALQVLKDCNWAIPSDKLVDEVRKSELVWRAHLLLKLSLLLHHKQFYLEGANVLKMLLESLQQDLNDSMIEDNITELDEIYNKSLEELLNAKNVEMALSLYKYFKFLGSVLYVRPTIWRAFIVSCITNGLNDHAEQIFDRCILMGIYKINMPTSSFYPACLKLSTYLTKEEISLILSHFLEKLFILLSSNLQKAEFEEIFSLNIILEETELGDSDHKLCSIPNTPASKEKTRKVVLHILQEVMKPPFDISPNSASDMINIEPMSLYQHFIFWKKLHPNICRNEDTATTVLNINNMAVIPKTLRKTEAFRTSFASSQYTGFGLECSSTSNNVANKSMSVLSPVSNKSFQISVNNDKFSTVDHPRHSVKRLFGCTQEPSKSQFDFSGNKNFDISFSDENSLAENNLNNESNVKSSFLQLPFRKKNCSSIKLNTAIKRHKLNEYKNNILHKYAKHNISWNKKCYKGNKSKRKRKRQATMPQKNQKHEANIPQKKGKHQANNFWNENKYETISQKSEGVETNEISSGFHDLKNIKMSISVDSSSVRTVSNSERKVSKNQSSSEDCMIANYPLISHSEPFILQTKSENNDSPRSEFSKTQLPLSTTKANKVCVTNKEHNLSENDNFNCVIINNSSVAVEQSSEKQQCIPELPKYYPITTVVSKANYSRHNTYHKGLDFQPQAIPVRQNSVARKPARCVHPQSLILCRPPRYHSNANVFYHRGSHIQESKNSYVSEQLSGLNDSHLQRTGYKECEALNKIQHFLKCQVLYRHNHLKPTECEARVSYLTNNFLSQSGNVIDTLDKRTMKKLTEFAAANV